MGYVKFYYHGISDNSLECLECIFKDKAILSRSQMDSKSLSVSNHEYVGYNGYDYISICEQYDNSGNITDCFEEYIRNNISLIIVNPTAIVKTNLINNINEQKYTNYQEYYQKYHHLSERYSDLIGEFQVYNRIPLKNVIALAYPLTLLLEDVQNSYMSKNAKIKLVRQIVKEYYQLKELLKKYGIDKPIVDLENWQLVDTNLHNSKYQIIKH